MTTPVDIVQGLSGFLASPPIGVLEVLRDELGPYTGNVTLTEWSSSAGPVFTRSPVNLTFGIYVVLSGPIPESYSQTIGWAANDGIYDESVFNPYLAQVVVQHQFPTGQWATTQLFYLSSRQLFVKWGEAAPGRIGLRTQPNISVDVLYAILHPTIPE